MPHANPPSTPVFRERLTAPVWWWVVIVVFAVSVFVAAAFGLGWQIAAPLTGALTAVAAWVVLSHGGTEIVVDETGLRVGRCRIEWRWIGGVRHLDAEQTQRRLRTEADARAHLEIRSYTPEAVEVTLADPADPHPYWLVSSRRPERLASAIAAHLGERADVA